METTIGDAELRLAAMGVKFSGEVADLWSAVPVDVSGCVAVARLPGTNAVHVVLSVRPDLAGPAREAFMGWVEGRILSFADRGPRPDDGWEPAPSLAHIAEAYVTYREGDQP